MEPNVPKQRSPWVYVVLGCGGFALACCLVLFAGLGYCAKKGADLKAGLEDPKTREENTRKMLGAIPEGYWSRAGVSVFGMVDTAILVNVPPVDDGGLEAEPTRVFAYYRLMSMQQNRKTKEFFTTESTDASGLRSVGIGIDPRDIVKRGNLTVDGRKMYYVVARGEVEAGGAAGPGEAHRLTSAILFDCPGDQLHVGLWMMADPTPESPTADLDFTGTVADEAEMAQLLRPLTPCGR